jgi:hypothetical protein
VSDIPSTLGWRVQPRVPRVEQASTAWVIRVDGHASAPGAQRGSISSASQAATIQAPTTASHR